MSFQVGGITFFEPGDLAQQPIGNVEGVITYLGNGLYTSPKSGFKLVGTYESQLRGGTPMGTLEIDAGGGFMIQSRGNYRLYTYSHQIQWYTEGYSLSTRPAGNNTVIVADGFAEWSSAKLKDNIEDLPISENETKLRARKYTLNGKPRFGFVVEDMVGRSEVVFRDGKEEGLDIVGLIAMQAKRIDYLEERVRALEAIQP